MTEGRRKLTEFTTTYYIGKSKRVVYSICRYNKIQITSITSLKLSISLGHHRLTSHHPYRQRRMALTRKTARRHCSEDYPITREIGDNIPFPRLVQVVAPSSFKRTGCGSRTIQTDGL